jgi:phenylpyruvate tautomerase PptA (4-oxalocrotonate tautomerase family)
MPHLTLHAAEADLSGREEALAAAVTDAIVAVYGEWVRDQISVQLVGVPPGRWAIGGRLVDHVPPSVTFGIREAVFARSDADTVVADLISNVTNAIASILGERHREGITVELVASPAGRTGVGGVVI